MLGSAVTVRLLVRRYGVSLRPAALIVSICIGVFGGFGSVLWGVVADRLNRRGAHLAPLLIAWISILASMFGLVGIFGSSLTMAIAGIACCALCITIFMSSGFALMINLSPPAIRGSCMAAAVVIINLVGAELGTLLVGGLGTSLNPIFAARSLPVALVIVVLLSIVGGACHFAVARTMRRELRPSSSALADDWRAPILSSAVPPVNLE